MRDPALDGAVDAALRRSARSGDTDGWVSRWHTWGADLLDRWDTASGRNELAADMIAQGMVAKEAPFVGGRLEELADARLLGGARARGAVACTGARFVVVEPTRTLARSPDGDRERLGIDPAIADAPLPVPALVAPAMPVRSTLPNGLAVVLWPRGNQPVVHAHLVIAAGDAHDPPGIDGVAELAGAERVEADSLTYSDTGLAIDADQLIAEVVNELRSPGNELDDDDKAMLADRVRGTSPREAAAFRRDVLAARGGMTADTVAKLHRDLVMGWARDHVVPKNATLVVAGKLDADLVAQHVRYDAVDVPAGSKTVPVAVAPIAKPGARYVRAVQTQPWPTVELDVESRGGPGLDRDYAKWLVLVEVLTAQLPAYTTTYTPKRGGGALRIWADVDVARVKDEATALAQALAAMRADRESYRAAFALARSKVLDRLLDGPTSASAVADALTLQAQFGVADDFQTQLAADVAKLTLADFQPFVADALARDGEVFGAFGNAEPADAAIAALRAGATP